MNKFFKEALDAGHVEEAPGPGGQPLVIAGKAYYQASDMGINMMMKRFSAFSDALRRHDTLKISDEALEAALKIQQDLLRKALNVVVVDSALAIDCIRESLTLTERIQQRRSFGYEVSQLYDIACLWYFTEEEDPGDVDTTLNKQKVIDMTMAPNAAELYAFFLHQPLGRFMPLSALLKVDILSYIHQANQLELLDLTRILTALKTAGLTSDTINSIESRRETLYGFDGLTGQLLNHTTTL